MKNRTRWCGELNFDWLYSWSLYLTLLWVCFWQPINLQGSYRQLLVSSTGLRNRIYKLTKRARQNTETLPSAEADLSLNRTSFVFFFAFSVIWSSEAHNPIQVNDSLGP